MSTMNISLPEQMKTWVETRAEQGPFANSSDYIRELIRRDQARQQAITTLQTALDEGLNSGPAEVFDPEAFLRARRG
ncbi:type II toxin-antitoxin system ParD family antitoxin [Frigidibacter mobilis]|uniref:Helix-turn-helix protein, CopG n=1 Tax=Frigidibacter mobilis TaxID=1335048 RepID=A0A159YYF8_9RHOB|nr:type II toxin-antitoxin system ParD family antitoxin [Frigidibacter mobilis]AMY67441.1 helix-turn-helix protein, CopG [Frigidibacter mobilis]